MLIFLLLLNFDFQIINDGLTRRAYVFSMISVCKVLLPWNAKLQGDYIWPADFKKMLQRLSWPIFIFLVILLAQSTLHLKRLQYMHYARVWICVMICSSPCESSNQGKHFRRHKGFGKKVQFISSTRARNCLIDYIIFRMKSFSN